MPRLPIPSDTEAFTEETRAAVRHILKTRHSMPPPSSYLTYAGQAGALLSDLVDHLRYHTSLTACGDGAGDLHLGAGVQRRLHLERARPAGPAGRHARGGAPRRRHARAAGRPDGGRGADHSLRA